MKPAFNVLVVDDDEVDRMAVRRAFLKAGVAVELSEACDGATAIATLKHQTYDCVFLDYRLPDKDGLTLVRELRCAGVNVPVVVLTGVGDEEIAVEMMKAGVSDYLAKSRVSPERLSQILRNAVRIHKAEMEVALASQKLRETEERYRFVLEGSNDGIWDWDLIQDKIYINDRFLEITGLSRSSFGGTYEAFCELIHPEDRERSMDAIAAHLEKGAEYNVEIKLRHSSGDDRYCMARGKAQRDPRGRPFRVAGAMTDITQRKRAEERLTRQNELLARKNQELERQRRQIQLQNLEVLKASRLKSEFLAMMSHELRTPMNAIIGFSQLLLRQRQHQLPAKQFDMVQRILNNGKNLLGLLNEVLDYSKIEAGRLEMKPEKFNLAQLALATAEELRSLADQKDLALQVDVELDNTEVVNDRTRLRQVLVNLLSNAIKFTSSGSVRLVVREESASQLEIAVIDTGIGIEEKDIENIFEAFRQADPTTRRQYSGTGLGLAIAKSLVEMMRGTIAVESTPGQGSAFWVKFPRKAHSSSQRGSGQLSA